MSKIYEFQDATKSLSTSENSEDADVALLQAMLKRFGYLREPFDDGNFNEVVSRAVKRFQRFHHLTIDGVVGPQTKTELCQPRCGHEDRDGMSGAFELRGCKYDKQTLTYAFTGTGTPDLTGNSERQIVREAFEVWAEVTPLRFVEVGPSDNPDFDISWESGSHGDGSGNAFDGPGRTLAHAYYPPPCGGTFAGSMHFDEGEQWITGTTGGINLKAVAVHEIGHLLGLAHSDVTSAIMFPNYRANVLTLGDDDIQGVQALYGAPAPDNEIITLSGQAAGNLTATGEQARFQVRLSGDATVTLDGPGDADFDLYIKRGTPPTRNNFDLRAWTVSADEELLVPVSAAADYHILVYSYRGDGAFNLRVTLA